MRRFRRVLPALLAFVLFIVLWEAASYVFAVPQYLVPAPSVIVGAMGQAWASIVINGGVTLIEAVIGLALSIVISVPLGVLLVYSPVLERIVYPFLVASQAIPKVALAPIFVVWFGFGLLPKVLIAFFIAFFPIVVNTVVGMSRTPPEMIHLMRSLGASPMQILLRVRLVAAAPYIFAGVKIAAAFAVVGAIVGEFIAADKGLGYLQLLANNNMQIPLLFGTLVALSIMGILLFYLIALVEFFVLPKPLRRNRLDEGGATI